MKAFDIEYHILKNIQKYGKADQKSILGKVIAAHPEAKKDIPALLKNIEQEIKAIKKISKEELQKKIFQLPAEEKKEKVEKDLPELRKVKGQYVFRFEPSPTGPLHIGHIIVLLLNAGYAKKYKGKLVIRLADTNPADIYQPAYQMIKEDVEWITQQKVEMVIQSDRMEDYYAHAKQLIDEGKAYVCTCSQDEFKKLIEKKKACSCREESVKEHKERWQKMFDEYESGEAVLRIKTDVKHSNPAVREWPAFRISDEEHPRVGKKYRVWPLMNFAVAVDDHDSGMTHVIRGKDHTVNMERQIYIFKHFGWEIPEYIHIGRINFKDLRISISQFREDIEKKKYSGWDDPRLPTIRAFRRRGLLPEAFMKYVKDLGPSKVDKTVAYDDMMKAIYAHNRILIDKKTRRFFFVENMKKITIKNAPKMKVQLPFHPEITSKDVRHMETDGVFYVEEEGEKNKPYRLMHLYNIKNNEFVSVNIDQSLNAKMIHWLPANANLVKVEIIMNDNTVKKGIGETSLHDAEIGEVIQFERKFFCRVEKKEKDKITCIYTHN